MILVCENNGFAEFTPRSAHTVVERVTDVVAPYGIERKTVDGNDVAAVSDASRRFLDRRAAGEGPFLLECLTHRLRGHYEGDPQRYREALEEEEWQRLDPILRLERRGRGRGLARRRCARRGSRGKRARRSRPRSGSRARARFPAAA